MHTRARLQFRVGILARQPAALPESIIMTCEFIINFVSYYYNICCCHSAQVPLRWYEPQPNMPLNIHTEAELEAAKPYVCHSQSMHTALLH